MCVYNDNVNENEWSFACHFTRGGNSDADYSTHLQHEQEVAIRARSARTKLAILIVQDSGVSAPNAMWRRKIAAVTNAPEFKGVCCAIVTNNTLIRGVLTALNWMRMRDYQEALFESTSVAIPWLEMSCGRSLPALRYAAEAWRTDSARKPTLNASW